MTSTTQPTINPISSPTSVINKYLPPPPPPPPPVPNNTEAYNLSRSPLKSTSITQVPDLKALLKETEKVYRENLAKSGVPSISAMRSLADQLSLNNTAMSKVPVAVSGTSSTSKMPTPTPSPLDYSSVAQLITKEIEKQLTNHQESAIKSRKDYAPKNLPPMGASANFSQLGLKLPSDTTVSASSHSSSTLAGRMDKYMPEKKYISPVLAGSSIPQAHNLTQSQMTSSISSLLKNSSRHQNMPLTATPKSVIQSTKKKSNLLFDKDSISVSLVPPAKDMPLNYSTYNDKSSHHGITVHKVPSMDYKTKNCDNKPSLKKQSKSSNVQIQPASLHGVADNKPKTTNHVASGEKRKPIVSDSVEIITLDD